MMTGCTLFLPENVEDVFTSLTKKEGQDTLDTNIEASNIEVYEKTVAKVKMGIPKKCLTCADFFTGEHCEECNEWLPEES